MMINKPFRIRNYLSLIFKGGQYNEKVSLNYEQQNKVEVRWGYRACIYQFATCIRMAGETR